MQKTKKRVVPNNNQDKWLVYLLQNLNKASELPWVEELLGQIEQSQDEFNAGKYRGAVFQMNYVAKETLTTRQVTMRSRQNSNVRVNQSSMNLGRFLAGQSIMDSLANNKKLHDSVNQELYKRMTNTNQSTTEDHSSVGQSQSLLAPDQIINESQQHPPSIAAFGAGSENISNVQFGLSAVSVH